MKKKILIFSDSCLIPTGYANMALQIATRLANDYGWEVCYVSHNYLGKVLEPGWTDGTRSYPFRLYGQGREQFCRDVLPIIIRKEQPQIVFTLLDTFMLYPWYFDFDFAPARSVFYFPSDGGGGLPKCCEQILKRMSLPIAMAKYGQRQAKELYNLDTVYIPHATDPEHYKRWSDDKRNALKAQWGLQGKFVVGTVARNQGRKVMDKTIKIFKGFAKDHQDAILLVHCDPLDPAGVFDLRALIHDLELDNRVVFTGATFYDGFPYSKMPEVYNLMDVFLLSTSGEGFGVPIIEAMSTSLPVVATSYTTTHEIVEQNNAGYGIRLSGCQLEDFFDLSPKDYDWRLVNGTVTGSWNVERGFCDVMHGVELLNKLYAEPETLKELGLNGRNAVLREYTWEGVAKQFDTVLSGLLRW